MDPIVHLLTRWTQLRQEQSRVHLVLVGSKSGKTEEEDEKVHQITEGVQQIVDALESKSLDSLVVLLKGGSGVAIGVLIDFDKAP